MYLVLESISKCILEHCFFMLKCFRELLVREADDLEVIWVVEETGRGCVVRHPSQDLTTPTPSCGFGVCIVPVH